MKFIGLFLIVVLLAGCATAKTKRASASSETPDEVGSAMGAVVGAVTGKQTSQEDLRKLGAQIRNDQEAQSAVESITGGMADPSSGAKYCPVDGERYSAKFESCPKHDVLLKNVEE